MHPFKKSHPSSGKNRYYRPLATRTLTLTFLLVATLLLIALLEYSCHVIPQHSGFGSAAEEFVNTTRAKLNERDADIHRKRAGETSMSSGESPSTSMGYAASPFPTTNSAPMFLSEKSTTDTVSLTGTESSYSTTTEKTTVPLATKISATYLTPDKSTSITSFAPPTDSTYLSPGTVAATKLDGSYMNPDSTHSIPTTSFSTRAPGMIISNTKSKTPSPVVVPVTSEYVSTIFPTSSSTIVDRPVATSANSSGTFVYHSNGVVTAPNQITYRQYLTASFLPLFLTIFYAIPWRILENTVRYMEPFYQLRLSSRFIESEAIHIDYESPSIFILPFKSLSRKNFVVFVTSLISVIMLAVAPLASQVMIIVESNYCVGTGLETCNSWGIYPNFARLLEGLLGSIAIFTLFLIVMGLRRDSGVYSEPLSLVGLAVIHRKTPLSSQAMEDSQIGLEEEETRIPSLRYTSLMTAEGETATATQDSALLRSKRREDSKKTSLTKVLEGIRARILHICMLCLLCGILGVVAAYYQTNADTGFNRFMNSQGFGVRFFMTALGTGTNLLWSRVDDDFRKMDPYYQLLRGNAKPQNSILAPVHMSPYSALIPCIGRKHYLVSWISFCSILSEFLPITLANIPYSNKGTLLVLLTCFYLAMAILSLMIIGVILLLLRSRHNVKSLPRKPCTIAARLEYLAPAGEVDGSNLLRSLDGLDSLEREERDARVISRGKLYSMGIGEDGKLRIDEDERIVSKWRKENRDGENV